MKCQFPECERTTLEPVERLRTGPQDPEDDRVEQDGGSYCETHALWVVAGCHLVTNRAGRDTDAAVQKLLARAGGRSRHN